MAQANANKLGRGATRISLSIALLIPWCLGPVKAADPQPQRPVLQGLGDLPGGRTASCALALSSDGQVVTGWASADAGTRAFIWKNGEMTGLGPGPDGIIPLVGHALSADGNIIVGLAQSGDGTVAFRWQRGETTPLSTPPGAPGATDAWGVSADGRTIVGHLQSPPGGQAIVWQAGAVSILPDPPGEQRSTLANAISADGDRIVGHSEFTGTPTALTWRGGEVLELPDLPGGEHRSESRGVSADGAVVIGVSASPFGLEACKWQSGVMTALGSLSREHEFLSVPRGISADGAVVVGYAIDDRDSSQAVVWDDVSGIRALATILGLEFGLDLQGWRLEVATGVSADGTTIVGCGRNPQGTAEAWALRLPQSWWKDEFNPYQPAAKAADNARAAVPLPRLGRGIDVYDDLLEPQGVALAADHTTYIADAGHNAVRVIDEDGEVQKVWGSPGSGLHFYLPHDVAVFADGTIVVADTGHQRVQVIDADGRLRRSWGTRGSRAGEFSRPEGVAVQGDRLYVTDTGNDRVQVFDRRGKFLFSVGSFGHRPGQLAAPSDAAVHQDGRLFVVDSGNDRVCVFGSTGEFIQCWGERGSSPGLFNHPTGIECRGDHVYVVDYGNHRVQVFSPDGILRYVWGRQALRPHEANGRIFYPTRIAVAPDQTRAVICEPHEDRCQSFGMFEDAPGSPGPFSKWTDVGMLSHVGGAIHISGEMLVATDVTADHVLVYRLTQHDPILITKIATPGYGAGQLSDPQGLCFNAEDGNLFVSDSANRRLQQFELRGLDDATATFKPNLGRLVKTLDPARLASFGVRGDSPSWRPGALARSRDGTLAIINESAGKILLLDRDLSKPRMIGASSGEEGELPHPIDLAFTHDGKRLLILDSERRAVVVFDSEGTYIVSWNVGAQADGEPVLPCGMEAGQDGFVYVSDCANHCIRKFDEEGSTITKWGVRGVGAGEFVKPRGIAQDRQGRIYVNDFGNRRIQVFSADGRFLRAIGPPLCIHPTLAGTPH